MASSSWLRRSVAILVLAGFVPVATTACFGKFQLTRKVYRVNQDIDPDKWIRWFAFIVLTVVPIYGLALVIDLLFANSVEFWTGANPIQADAGTRKIVQGPNGELMTLTWRGDGAIDVTVEGADRRITGFTVVTEGNALSAWDPDGNLLARVTDVAGQPANIAGRSRDQ
jgi:hypothetical protein